MPTIPNNYKPSKILPVESIGKRSDKTLEELEILCEELTLHKKIIKDKLREVSKLLNMVIKEI
jgi:hypothetical protein